MGGENHFYKHKLSDMETECLYYGYLTHWFSTLHAMSITCIKYIVIEVQTMISDYSS